MTMNSSENALKIADLIKSNHHFVVIQPDNPDTDSLASALALEHILGDLDKQVDLVCAIDLPSYLKSFPGADRVTSELPKQFDCSIIVDTASISLLEQLDKSGQKAWLTARPVIVLDHHQTEATISFATVLYCPKAAATGEVVYELAKQLKWPINLLAMKLLAAAILSDSQGLSSDSTSARTVHIIGELVESGVSLAELEQQRRESLRRSSELVHYKGELLQRVLYHSGDRIATVVIPWEEIEKYSPSYNPSMLVIDDMRLANNTDLAVCFKVYQSGRITAKIRSNYGKPIAAKLAEHFGGGGHDYASGFKVDSGRSVEQITQELITKANELLGGDV